MGSRVFQTFLLFISARSSLKNLNNFSTRLFRKQYSMLKTCFLSLQHYHKLSQKCHTEYFKTSIKTYLILCYNLFQDTIEYTFLFLLYILKIH